MAMQMGIARRPGMLVLWWWRRLARLRQIEDAGLDLHDRFGPAAYGLARNTARRGRRNERRFWRRVARRARRISEGRRSYFF